MNTFTETARRAAHPDPLTAALPLSRRAQPAADLLDGDGAWRDSALCAQVDPEMFFPEKGASNAAARAICRNCPVRIDCLAEAVDKTLLGVWGNSSDKERVKIRTAGWTGQSLKAYAAANGGRVPFSAKGGRSATVKPVPDHLVAESLA